MKRLLALVLATIMTLALVACGTKEKETIADYDYIKSKGKMVVGITEFEPMDYQDANGKWIGFDADLATAFAKSLGVEVEFVVIEWDNKVFELEGKTIDCVWNGMTLTDEVKSAMECSRPYCNNSQVIVMRSAIGKKSSNPLDFKAFSFAVEAGSAGEEMATKNQYNYTPVETQALALLEVKSKTADACIIDKMIAAAMTGAGTDYADLIQVCELNSEVYGVGFRKGSDMAQKLNDFFTASYADGSMMAIAETYNIAGTIIAQ